MQAILKAKTSLKAIKKAWQSDALEEPVVQKDDDPELHGEDKLAMNDMCKMNANVGNDLSLDERVRMLNADQKRVFDNVTRHLLHQKQHEDRECTCNDLKPL